MSLAKTEYFSNGVEDDISDEETHLDSDESNEEDEKSVAPPKKAKFDRDGLNDKLEDIKWPDDVRWIESLAIDVNTALEVDVNDDLAREHSFYSQALEGTREAFEKLESMGLPFLRPSDYYAEMVKSDAHMEKVKGRLLAEKKEIEEAEERRKTREAKRIAKEVQAQKVKEKAAQKKTEIEAVKKWRKQREKGRKGGNEEMGEIDFEDGLVVENTKRKLQGVAPGDRSGGRGGKKKGNKRDQKNAKFGFGGRKGSKKQNTSSTTDDFSKLNPNKSASFGNKRRKKL